MRSGAHKSSIYTYDPPQRDPYDVVREHSSSIPQGIARDGKGKTRLWEITPPAAAGAKEGVVNLLLSLVAFLFVDGLVSDSLSLIFVCTCVPCVFVLAATLSAMRALRQETIAVYV